MGLSHGGLRQKMFNVYEETIRVPLVDLVARRCSPARPRPTRSRRSSTSSRRWRRSPAPTRPAATSAGATCRRSSRATRRGRQRAARAASRRRLGARVDPLHLRRPPGRHGVQERVRPAEPDPRGPRQADEVRGLLRPERRGASPSTSCTTSSATRSRSTTSPSSAPGRRAEMAEQLAAVAAECGTDLPS